MARPKIFVSSTYYDLKYLRERLERFIRKYNFEPILFEDGDVYYNPNKPIDQSCYSEVEQCQMMILIVGGKYGTIIKNEKDKANYNDKHVSITQKEYKTAIDKGIPVMVFIEKNVYIDYETYRNNTVSTIPKDFKFAHIDTTNIFDFISILNLSVIKTFEKVEEIEEYFANQVSGMFYDYLKQLQDKKQDDDVLTSVNQLKQVTEIILSNTHAIAKDVFKDNKPEYDKIIFKQNTIIIDFFIDLFIECIKIDFDYKEINDTLVTQIVDLCFDTILNNDSVNSIYDNNSFDWEKYNCIYKDFMKRLLEINNKIKITKFNYLSFLRQFKLNIMSLIIGDDELKKYINDKMIYTFKNDILCPF